MFRGYFGGVSLAVCTILLCNNYADAMTMVQLRNAVKPLRNGCANHVGVDIALVEAMDKGEFSEDKAFQCYTNCVMNYLKMMKDGKPVLSTTLKQIKFSLPKDIQARATEVATYCHENSEFDDDPCVTAWNMVKCQYIKDPEVFFFP